MKKKKKQKKKKSVKKKKEFHLWYQAKRVQYFANDAATTRKMHLHHLAILSIITIATASCCSCSKGVPIVRSYIRKPP